MAFIGGSGLYDMDGLTDREEMALDTPFGHPSDPIVVGTLADTTVAFLPRHGRGHRISPTNIPVMANIYSLKCLGVERIVSISAVGSLREEVRPLDILVPDQIIDRTKSRTGTFFEDGIVAHVGFADPFCPTLSGLVAQTARMQEVTAHEGGTYVVIEGPQFSTRAESELYRSWGASVIGMTALPEAKLAREAEICYSTMALVTDYDCWHESEEAVSVELVVGRLSKNASVAQQIVRDLLPRLPAGRDCACGYALKNAIITNPELIPHGAADRLSVLVRKYLTTSTEVI